MQFSKRVVTLTRGTNFNDTPEYCCCCSVLLSMAGNLLRTYAALLNKAKSTQKTASRYKAKTAFKLAAKLGLLHGV